MKKLLSIFIILVLVSSFSFSQDKGKMVLAVDGAITLPFGDFGDVYKMGFGGTATFMYFVHKNIGLSLTAGYLMWDADIGDVTFSAIPVLVGARYTFGKDKLLPYVLVKTGMYFGSVDVPSVTVGGITVGGGTATSSDFGAGGGVGLMYQVGNKVFLDVNAQMNAIFGDGSTSTFAEFNLGAAFCLN